MKMKLAKLLKYRVLIFLLLIIAAGFLVRIYRISEVPLYGDELTILLDANSLLHTGHDQTGKLLPLTFSMGAGRPAGYVYGSIPFVAVFGENIWGVRGLSLLSGLALVGLIFLLAKKLFDQRVGLTAAILMAFSMWDINLSRGGFEAHFALMLAVLGVIGLLYAKQKPWWMIISAICFGTTFHTYPTYKIVLPLFLLGYVFINASEIKSIFQKSKMAFILSVITFLVFGFLAVSQTFFSSSESRFLNINVFSDSQVSESITQKINYERSTTRLPKVVASLFHNRPLEYAKVVGNNYFANFSWQFLFLNGDKNPRHNMSTTGYFYLFEIVTICLGFILLILKKRWRILGILLVWVFVSPIATSLITDPHGLRSAFLLPSLILLSSLGLGFILSVKRYSTLIFGIILFSFLGQFIYFGEKLYYLAPSAFGRFWAEEGKNAAALAIENKSKYDFVVISDKIDSIEYSYPVYAKTPASEVIAQHAKNESFMPESNGFKKFDNVYIGSITAEELKSDTENTHKSVLYIGKLEDKEHFSNYESIKGCDNADQLIIARYE